MGSEMPATVCRVDHKFVEWITSALYYNARLNENYYEDEYDDYFWNFETKMMDAMYQFIRGVPNELEDL